MKVNIGKERFGPWGVRLPAHWSGIRREFARQIAAAGINVALVAGRETTLIEVGRGVARDFEVQFRVIVMDLSQEGLIAEARRAYEGSRFRPCRLECWHGKPGRIPEARSAVARGDLAAQHDGASGYLPPFRSETRRAEAGRLDPRGGNGCKKTAFPLWRMTEPRRRTYTASARRFTFEFETSRSATSLYLQPGLRTPRCSKSSASIRRPCR